MHNNPKTIMDWQRDLVAIPAPPFGEQARSEWLSVRFREAGLQNVEVDAIGDVFGTIPAPACRLKAPAQWSYSPPTSTRSSQPTFLYSPQLKAIVCRPLEPVTTLPASSACWLLRTP